VIQKVLAFVDWDSARRIVEQPAKGRGEREISIAMDRLCYVIARYLEGIDKKGSFHVRWRIYHGWHRGKTKSPDRDQFETYIQQSRSRRIGGVAFGSDFAFGNELACISKRRVLYDTLRTNERGEDCQKMVDTAIACDLLHVVRWKEADVHIVIGDDDDLLPAIFTADAWKAKVVMLTHREACNKHLKTEGLVQRMVWQ
jgi:hypothetical protein